MTDNSFLYSCSNCGAQYPKWQGRCLECGKWGTINQQPESSFKGKISPASPDRPINLAETAFNVQKRLKTEITELDRVLGGGLVAGSVVLLAGQPGGGKSTLAGQIAKGISGALYVSGEESAEQVKIRSERIGLDLAKFQFLPQTEVEKIVATLKKIKPPVAIIDSIQTLHSQELPAGPGSLNQITASAAKLIEAAKTSKIPILIIGHITKEGTVAGPKVLEHLVDTVLYLENDSQNFYKILRSVKNRFGSTGEIGIFEMTRNGLEEITDPSALFLAEKNQPANGSITTIVLEGSRPFLVEVQALTVRTIFGYPQRKSTGFDLNRLQMLTAVLVKIGKINLGNQDIYLNIAGGLKIKETASDLAVSLAIASAFLNLPIPRDALAFGEVGLAGEIRPVAQFKKRIAEAEKLQFNKIIGPETNLAAPGLLKAKTISEAISLLKSLNEKRTT